ncbi:MAG: diguanylate cyclase [Proteobacteria bacterium]|nr:diguanylate cyclase [Pseudomonadota bacterium]MBU1713540.1 diguanylate cyclase [Pseudomonadota bacterium]
MKNQVKSNPELIEEIAVLKKRIQELEQLKSERRQVEEALREGDEKYRQLMDNMADVITVIDMNLRFTYVSPSIMRIRGYTAEEAVVQTFEQVMTPVSLQIFAKVFEEEMKLEASGTADPRRSRILELDLYRKDGSIVCMENNLSFLRDDAQKPAGIILMSRDITERKRTDKAQKESEKKYRELNIIDELTNLYNSRYFYFQLKIETDRVIRYGGVLTLIILDIDNFREFNDAYGFLAGDHVLLRLGQVLKRCLRQTDSAYRYRGEEFTIILPMTTGKNGSVIAERIRTEFNKEVFSHGPDNDIHMTASIGIAQYKLFEEMKSFVKRVDQLKYQAWKNGKDRVCFES